MKSWKPIVWKDEYSVGFKDLDDDHKVLVDLINRLCAAIETGAGRAELRRTLGSLARYIDSHFRREEAVMRDGGYEGYRDHVTNHLRIEKRVGDFIVLFDSGAGEASPDEIADFLHGWLIEHILKADMKYSVAILGESAPSSKS